MARVNKLKNQARREEQRENWSRAIELYTQALDASRKESEGFVDLSLYNRIGDIYLRIGQKNTAVRYYEQAIELYAEQDLHTSAIALCNKVLRILPDRSTVFLQLGRLNLATNLLAEGRAHYHRYATAMRRRGSEEAALEALEELVASTGDANTLTVWAGWLAESSDTDAAAARIESLRADLERHGIDPDEVATQVRSKEVVGFEGRGGEAPAADPLAAAFLTLGDDAPAPASAGVREGTREPAAPAGEEPAIAGEADAAEEGRETPDPEFVSWEADVTEGTDAGAAGVAADEPASPADEPDDPAAPVEPGSVPWEQEVEEIIAEFDLAVEEPWAELSPEPGDPAAEDGGHVRSRPDPEASEAFTSTWTHASPRRPQAVEGAEFDELEVMVPRPSFAGTLQAEGDEDAGEPEPDAALAVDRIEREAVEAPEGGMDAPPLEPVGGEGSEPADADAGPEPEAAAAADEEGAEAPAGLVGEGLEPAFEAGTDELEAIVHAAAALGESGGFDAEPVVADEFPEPEPEEPNERDVEVASRPEPAPRVASPEPSDPDAPAPEDGTAFESLEGLVESMSTLDDPAPSRPASLSMEGDEDVAGDDVAGWMDDARRTLDEHARSAEEEAEAAHATGESKAYADSPAPSEPPAAEASGDVELDAEATAVEGAAADGHEADTGPTMAEVELDPADEPEPADEPTAAAVSEPAGEREPAGEPEPAVEPERAGELDPTAGEPEPAGEPERAGELDPAADEPEPAGAREPAVESAGAGVQPANGRPRNDSGAGTTDPDETRGPLAEPRLTVEEDPEDAFRDWVESASTGVLKRALSELESRQEHERALAVLRRLTRLEATEIDFRIRLVEYLQRLDRTEEAVEASLALAAMLETEGRLSEARAAYERTRRLAPDETRALEGLTRLEGVEDETQEEAVHSSGPKRPYMPDHMNGTDRGSVIDRPLPSMSVTTEGEGAAPRPYSGVAGGSEAGADFEQLLSEFRAELHEKPARNDSSSRTELGARLKEMGRLDDAIRELQAAVREPSAPPLAFELLGEAFLEKGQPRIAVRFLEKALGSLAQGDRDILGVLYQLGIAYEALSDLSKALICYERIFSVDIDYRDIQERILRCSA